MNITKQDQKFIIESNGKTYTIPFISNIIIDEKGKEYCVGEITWDKEPSKPALDLITKLSAPKLKKKK